jgi:hypothetical protein
MNTLSAPPEQIEQAIRALPPSAQVELAQFIDYLRFKYGNPEPTVVTLAGLWADVELNISQDDVRQLREDLSSRLITRFSEHELPG